MNNTKAPVVPINIIIYEAYMKVAPSVHGRVLWVLQVGVNARNGIKLGVIAAIEAS